MDDSAPGVTRRSSPPGLTEEGHREMTTGLIGITLRGDDVPRVTVVDLPSERRCKDHYKRINPCEGVDPETSVSLKCGSILIL